MRWREAFGSLGLSSGSRSPQAVDLNLITDIFNVKRVLRQENDRGFPCIPKTVRESVLSNQMKSYLKVKPYCEWCTGVDRSGHP